MKTFKAVEAARTEYHLKPALNSVHRSSLIVPVIEGNDVELSFLNHFLIKRNYEEVVCRITAVTKDGGLVASLDFMIDQPRVYNFELKKLFDEFDSDPAAYNIEFYSSKNFFIPYTAAIVNHVGSKIVNQVHAYNRILNDVFEDDKVNAILVKEACIDVIKNQNVETFFVFNAGMYNIDSELSVELTLDNNESVCAKVPIKVARYNSLMLRISDIFNELPEVYGGYLRVMQPRQNMFYGRMLCGCIDPEGNIVANHSYYDSSDVAEYWDDSFPSSRCYPFHPDFELLFRVYPIISQGLYEFEVIAVLSDKGDFLLDTVCLQSPSFDFLEINVNKLLNKANIDLTAITTIKLSARNTMGNTPTRITHQLVYRNIDGVDLLGSSVNVSLFNRNVYIPENRTGRIWGQVIVGKVLSGYLGITTMHLPKDGMECTIKLYSQSGLLDELKVTMLNNTYWLDVNETILSKQIYDVLPERLYIWYWVTSDNPNISACSLTKNDVSNYVTAEHSF